MKKIKRITLIAAAFLLTACAGNPVKGSVTSNEISEMAVIVFSVSHDIQAKNGAKAIFYLDNENTTERVVLKSVQDTLSIPTESDFSTRRGHLYVLQVTLGHHQFDAWQVSSAGARIFPKTLAAPLEFEANKGDVIYLGNLHTKLLLGHGMLFGGRAASDAIPLIQDMSEEDIPLAESRTPAIKGKIRRSLLPIGPWVTTEETVKRTDPIPIPIVTPKN
jgi:hypothetical protein